MTALLARPPLQELPMTKVQSGSRRHSARLQQREDSVPPANGAAPGGGGSAAAQIPRAQTSAANPKKRKAQYDEDDDGFKFSRVKKNKTPPPPPPAAAVPPQPAAQSGAPAGPVAYASPIRPPRQGHRPAERSRDDRDDEPSSPPKQKRRRMSFSTPPNKEQQPARRSKRLSAAMEEKRISPRPPPSPLPQPSKIRKDKAVKHRPPAERGEHAHPSPIPNQHQQNQHQGIPATSSTEEDHASTKIALPFADTPVISRNKAMREGKSGKGERRSSLGLRGRRASSLIESGNSNALPHTEVEPQDFYKHIESDLMEPRRMRQLLTWCATRAMHPKPQGMAFEEASAQSAARVIEEELLKDLANNSDLSDWFSREDVAEPAAPLPERPNPKNAANLEKILELEEQIQRLRAEKQSLEALSRPAEVPEIPGFSESPTETLDHKWLSETDRGLLTALDSASVTPTDVASKVNKLTASLGPAVDTFADGVHKVNQYRVGADHVASQVLSVCAEKLADRERAGRRRALGTEGDRSPGRDLSGVLRGLSKVER